MSRSSSRENGGSEDYFPFQRGDFQVLCSFGGCIHMLGLDFLLGYETSDVFSVAFPTLEASRVWRQREWLDPITTSTTPPQTSHIFAGWNGSLQLAVSTHPTKTFILEIIPQFSGWTLKNIQYIITKYIYMYISQFTHFNPYITSPLYFVPKSACWPLRIGTFR